MSLPRSPLPTVLGLLLVACSSESSEPDGGPDAADGDLSEPDAELPFVPVIDQREWRNYPAALDPLGAHQPAQIDCNIAGWFIERGALEVSTADCNYLLVEHPAQIAVPEGSNVQLELVHFDLDAPEAAMAHVAVLFGDEVQWQLEIPIPRYAYVYKETFRATRALREGELVRLHLHNHGQNTWVFSSLYAQVP